MLSIQNVTYTHPDKELLFKDINLSVRKQDKAALIGNNGSGKSTLLKILAGKLKPSSGSVHRESIPYYIPQHFGQFNDLTVAQALQVENKLSALHQVLEGNGTDNSLAILEDDWTIEERCIDALSFWKINEPVLNRTLHDLSGGEKTKVLLAGIQIHDPDIILLDEPTNHLDSTSRELLYSFVKATDKTLIVISHDRVLLEMLSPMYELSKKGLNVYGGNYSFYKAQKSIEENALFQYVENRERALKAAKKIEREAIERKQRQNSRGKRKLEKENAPRIVRKTMRNKAEATTSNLKKTHSEKIDALSEELKQFREKMPELEKIKLDFKDSILHKGKMLATGKEINFSYGGKPLWSEPLYFRVASGDRVCIKGVNGSGKSTLLNIILGNLKPTEGELTRADFRWIYMDQDYSMIDPALTVYEQVQKFNLEKLEEHEIKIRLNRFLFDKEFWRKSCGSLSGGEKMRVSLCCLMVCECAPDMFVLDEPTNNLDLENIGILASAVNNYSGTVMVVSHDISFLEEIGITEEITLR